MTTVMKRMNEHTGKPEYRSVGDSIKAADGNRVTGYLVRFTDADDPDLHGEYFTKSTNFWLREHSPIGKPIMLDHAFDPKFKSVPVGILDFIREDETGLWIEGKLKERAEYEDMLRGWKDRKYIDLSDEDIAKTAYGIEKAVKAFFGSGKAQWSSGALPQSVEVAEDGHIKSWALIEGTGVMTPAEPDGTEIKIKSAFSVLDDILNSIPTATATKEHNLDAKGLEADNVERGDGNTRKLNDDKNPSKGGGEMPKKQDEITEEQKSEGLDEALVRQIVRMVIEENDKMSGESVIEEEDLVDAIAMDTDEEVKELDEEEAAKRVANKAWEVIDARLAQREKALNAARGISRKRALNAPVSEDAFLPAASNLKGGNGNGALQIRTITAYDNWTPQDFSFAVDVARQSRSLNRPIINESIVTKAFMNQFADKAIKAHQSGDLKLNNNAIKAINAIKANELDYSTQSGFGDEWVFTGWRDQIWDTPRLDLVYTQLQAEDMPSNPYEVPVESTDPSVYFVSETADEDQLGRNDSNAAIPDTKIATNKVQLNAKKHALRVNWSAELQEDAISSAIPKFRAQAQRAVEDAIELSVLLGDATTGTTNINYDGGTPGATESYLAYDGLLHQALVTATTNAVDAGGNAPTLAHIRSLRSKLGNAQGFNPNNLAIFTDFPTYMKLLSIDAVLTEDKFGANATVRSGTLGMIDGINIFVSGQMQLAASDGKITFDTAGTTGRLMMVYLPDWYRGFRRRIASHVNYLPFADAWEMVLTVRHALSARSYNSSGAQQSTDDSVAVLYNIGV